MQTNSPGRIDSAYVWMIVPAAVLFTAMLTVPFLTGVFYTFTNYQGYGDWRFVGLQNYLNLFRDDVIWGSYGFTFLYAITATILINLIALSIALLLNSKIKGQTFFRGLFFLPNILPVLIVAYIFQYLFTNNLPAIGEALGWEWLSTSLLANENTAWMVIVFVGVWQAVAFNTIIYLAGLQTVPEEVYEAASIDGANRWQQFLNVTLPGLRPTFVFIFITITISAFSLFTQIDVMTSGGPANATTTLVYHIIQMGSGRGDVGYGSALSLIFFIIVLAVTLLQRALTKED